MANSPVRIILDTNLWISFLITKNHTKLSLLLISGQVMLIFSTELLSEFISVTQRPKMQKYFSEVDITRLTEVINDYAIFIKVTSNIMVVVTKKIISYYH